MRRYRLVVWLAVVGVVAVAGWWWWHGRAPEVRVAVAARGGLHVLRVVEIRAAAPRPLDEVRERIHAKLNQERFDERLKVFLAELADEAYVVESLPADAVGYRSSSASASVSPRPPTSPAASPSVSRPTGRSIPCGVGSWRRSTAGTVG